MSDPEHRPFRRFERFVNGLRHKSAEPQWPTPPANRIRKIVHPPKVLRRNKIETADPSAQNQEVFHWYPTDYAKRKDWILTRVDIEEILARSHQGEHADRGYRVSTEESIMKLFADIEEVKNCTFREQTYEKKNRWPFELAGVSFELNFKRKKRRFIQDRDSKKRTTRTANSIQAHIVDSVGEKVTGNPLPRKEILIVNLTDDNSMRLALMTAISLGLSDHQEMYTPAKGKLRAVVWVDNPETFRTVRWKRGTRGSRVTPDVQEFQYNGLASKT